MPICTIRMNLCNTCLSHRNSKTLSEITNNMSKQWSHTCYNIRTSVQYFFGNVNSVLYILLTTIQWHQWLLHDIIDCLQQCFQSFMQRIIDTLTQTVKVLIQLAFGLSRTCPHLQTLDTPTTSNKDTGSLSVFKHFSVWQCCYQGLDCQSKGKGLDCRRIINNQPEIRKIWSYQFCTSLFQIAHLILVDMFNRKQRYAGRGRVNFHGRHKNTLHP